MEEDKSTAAPGSANDRKAASALTDRQILNAVAQALFVDRDVSAFAQFVSDEQYVQHNPLLPDGKDAVIRFLGAMSDRVPKATLEHVVLDGDIGIVHARFDTPPGVAPYRIVDMFRIRDGKLVEHWDVINFDPTQFM